MFALAGLPLLFAACGASQPSKELLSARDAYAKLGESDASQVNPAATREAQRALQDAEKAHNEDEGSEQARSAAYIAARKSELAMAQAEEFHARQEREKADQAYQAQLEQQLASTQQELQAQQEQVKMAQAGWRKKGEDLVLTLSGTLFKSGSTELTPEGTASLDKVVDGVKRNQARTITIAGYTDSKGATEANMTLSQKRADAVKAYLQGQGAEVTQMSSVGRGESDPIASNDTAEGRAGNRRIEITMQGAGEASERQPVKGTDTEPMETGAPK
jgi:outer membrane protein OmpA-like peptidoglycan-associated protein